MAALIAGPLVGSGVNEHMVKLADLPLRSKLYKCITSWEVGMDKTLLDRTYSSAPVLEPRTVNGRKLYYVLFGVAFENLTNVEAITTYMCNVSTPVDRESQARAKMEREKCEIVTKVLESSSIKKKYVNPKLREKIFHRNYASLGDQCITLIYIREDVMDKYFKKALKGDLNLNASLLSSSSMAGGEILTLKKGDSSRQYGATGKVEFAEIPFRNGFSIPNQLSRPVTIVMSDKADINGKSFILSDICEQYLSRSEKWFNPNSFEGFFYYKSYGHVKGAESLRRYDNEAWRKMRIGFYFYGSKSSGYQQGGHPLFLKDSDSVEHASQAAWGFTNAEFIDMLMHVKCFKTIDSNHLSSNIFTHNLTKVLVYPQIGPGVLIGYYFGIVNYFLTDYKFNSESILDVFSCREHLGLFKEGMFTDVKDQYTRYRKALINHETLRANLSLVGDVYSRERGNKNIASKLDNLFYRLRVKRGDIMAGILVYSLMIFIELVAYDSKKYGTKYGSRLQNVMKDRFKDTFGKEYVALTSKGYLGRLADGADSIPGISYKKGNGSRDLRGFIASLYRYFLESGMLVGLKKTSDIVEIWDNLSKLHHLLNGEFITRNNLEELFGASTNVSNLFPFRMSDSMAAFLDSCKIPRFVGGNSVCSK